MSGAVSLRLAAGTWCDGGVAEADMFSFFEAVVAFTRFVEGVIGLLGTADEVEWLSVVAEVDGLL